MQAVMLASCNDKSRDHDDREVIEIARSASSNVDAMQFLHVALRPDFGTHQAADTSARGDD